MPAVTVIQPTLTEEKTAKIRCAAYCRVSSDSEDQLNSFMAQTRYYSQLFEDSEAEELIDIYADEGITGTREDKRGEFFYLVKVRTHKNAISYRKEQLPIIPGMVTTVDILTGKKTVLDYILKPILKARQNALRER